jgi:hypothetical protein
MTPVLGVSTAVVTSVIAAIASLVGALITAILGQRIKRRNDERLEQVKAELAESQAERNAQRDYRYEAIKRLYTDLQPLLFQLSEVSGSAYKHTRGLARTARNGQLGTGPDSWLHDKYYLLSTVYRLLVPVAVVTLISRRLTLVDLSLDDELRSQYRFAHALAGTWNSGFDLAEKEPALPYKPHHRDAEALAVEQPSVYGLQHLFAGQIDQIVTCLLVADPDGRVRHRTYGEFEDAFKAGSISNQVAPAVKLLSTFHPRTHPVLWRMLVVQAHLYCGVARTFSEAPGVVVGPTRALPAEEWTSFDWREPDAPENEDKAVGGTFRAAHAYLDEVLAADRSS